MEKSLWFNHFWKLFTHPLKRKKVTKPKILVIGQAPPAQAQEVPYDTTMMYDWLQELGISKEQAQEMFEWDAVYDKFPGFTWAGQHKIPSKQQMDEYWNRELETKIMSVDKVWLVGRVASEYFWSKEKTWSCNLKVHETMHPSLRNIHKYKLCKDDFLAGLKQFIND